MANSVNPPVGKDDAEEEEEEEGEGEEGFISDDEGDPAPARTPPCAFCLWSSTVGRWDDGLAVLRYPATEDVYPPPRHRCGIRRRPLHPDLFRPHSPLGGLAAGLDAEGRFGEAGGRLGGW